MTETIKSNESELEKDIVTDDNPVPEEKGTEYVDMFANDRDVLKADGHRKELERVRREIEEAGSQEAWDAKKTAEAKILREDEERARLIRERERVVRAQEKLQAAEDEKLLNKIDAGLRADILAKPKAWLRSLFKKNN